MALIKMGILKSDQYVEADIYNPPWDLINNYDGTNGFLLPNETNHIQMTKIDFMSEDEGEFSDKSC
jgi:hypothetical protein